MSTARLIDVAAAAGVSISTVSRVLRLPEQVAPETRARVEAAVAATGYQANDAARNLRLGRSGTVLALVPNLANRYHAEVLGGLAEGLGDAGLALLVSTGPRAGGFDPRRSDGLVLLDAGFAGQVAQLESRWGPRPTVVADVLPGEAAGEVAGEAPCRWPQVVADNAAGARALVAHLHGAGRRRIGWLRGPQGSGVAVLRDRAIAAALDALGLPAEAAWVAQAGFGAEDGQRAAAMFLALPQAARPDAVIAPSDAAAVGFATSLLAAGLRIPEDLALTGFDDLDLASCFRVPLTTVALPRHAIGRAAAALLLAQIAGQPVPPRQVLPVTLVCRASSGM